MRVVRFDARGLAGGAVITGLVAVASLLIAVAEASGDPNATQDDGAGWLAGMLLAFGPALTAGIALSVASSALLRPVGIPATVLGALAAAVHVGVVVDERGGVGTLLAVPAVLTIVFLVTALVGGPVIRRTPEPPRSPERAEPVDVTGSPLDVLGALHDARAHAARALAAWFVVVALTAAVSPLALRVLGWPEIAATFDAEVVEIEAAEVVFEGEHEGHAILWAFERSEDSGWEVGDQRTAHLDEDGRVHLDEQLGLAGIPVAFAALFPLIFLGFALRRLWGVVVAAFDAGRGTDQPRLGYVALVRPYRSWRPLVAVWWQQPTTDGDLTRPDAVYRADDDAATDLSSTASAVIVHRAWVDTGWKPRWIAAEEGVVVPHRRALLGPWHFRLLTRDAEVGDLVELHHSAPTSAMSVHIERRGHPHRFVPMVAWRLLAAPVGLLLPLLDGPGGEMAARQLR